MSGKCVNVGGGDRFLPLWNVAADISCVKPNIASHSDNNLFYDPLVDVPIARVTQNYDVWKRNLLGGDDDLFVLNGILNGFSIVDLNCTLPRFATKNYRSTSDKNKLKVEARILEEIHAGNYIRTSVSHCMLVRWGPCPRTNLT